MVQIEAAQASYPTFSRYYGLSFKDAGSNNSHNATWFVTGALLPGKCPCLINSTPRVSNKKFILTCVVQCHVKTIDH